jgi:hypothetical protein
MRTTQLGCAETGFVALFDNYATTVGFASYLNSAETGKNTFAVGATAGPKTSFASQEMNETCL